MYPQNQQPQQPLVPQVFDPTQVVPPQQPAPQIPGQPPVAAVQKGKSKLFYAVLAGGIVIVLLLIVTVVIAASAPGTKKPVTSTQSQQDTSSLTAASSLSVQQGIDAVNQNLSSLNDSTDFSADALSDAALSRTN